MLITKYLFTVYILVQKTDGKMENIVPMFLSLYLPFLLEKKGPNISCINIYFLFEKSADVFTLVSQVHVLNV